MKPVEVRRRIVNGFAVQVTHDNSTEVAKWCGGHTWASAVVVPVVDGDRPGEQFAPPGTWVVLSPHGWQVWPDHRFRAEWAPTDGLPVPPRVEARRRRWSHPWPRRRHPTTRTEEREEQDS